LNSQKKWLDISFVAMAFLVFFVLRQFLIYLWGAFGFSLQSRLILNVPEIISLGLAFLTLVILKRHAKVNEFGLNVVAELSKVVWSGRKETFTSAGVILVMVGFAALALSLLDVFWTFLANVWIKN